MMRSSRFVTITAALHLVGGPDPFSAMVKHLAGDSNTGVQCSQWGIGMAEAAAVQTAEAAINQPPKEYPDPHAVTPTETTKATAEPTDPFERQALWDVPPGFGSDYDRYEEHTPDWERCGDLRDRCVTVVNTVTTDGWEFHTSIDCVQWATPTYNTPKPTYTTPKPTTYTTPKPTYTTPKPTYTTPKPTYTTPKPTYTKPPCTTHPVRKKTTTTIETKTKTKIVTKTKTPPAVTKTETKTKSATKTKLKYTTATKTVADCATVSITGTFKATAVPSKSCSKREIIVTMPVDESAQPPPAPTSSDQYPTIVKKDEKKDEKKDIKNVRMKCNIASKPRGKPNNKYFLKFPWHKAVAMPPTKGPSQPTPEPEGDPTQIAQPSPTGRYMRARREGQAESKGTKEDEAPGRNEDGAKADDKKEKNGGKEKHLYVVPEPWLTMRKSAEWYASQLIGVPFSTRQDKEDPKNDGGTGTGTGNTNVDTGSGTKNNGGTNSDADSGTKNNRGTDSGSGSGTGKQGTDTGAGTGTGNQGADTGTGTKNNGGTDTDAGTGAGTGT
ncbi:hypothetical protein SODALDRAFT_109770 [Sodiomyces alkalinus F11]|uniref:Uncharacterized protein n=1 Tax=Sodiomyces alkalinus (strain CBS 110278 / VKM F-3762 / F11) TaxID=1314773 RepID=A0A3N2Q2R3_SODAK|nr:hypothetical protein SODALDRAFT_109770 [Sodiomyces alkalinus F11]ROT41022.1 hypothetical protein SODALDRAFT_109770 [Sodiomyces alkalinus F11]